MPVLLGIDTGGTYTDAVLFDEDKGVVADAKALTTRHDLSIGIGGAVDAVLGQSGVSGSDIALVSLSTTLATNALVEGQGGRVCLVLVGFDETALSRAGLAEALKDDPYVLVAGGHDAHGNPRAMFDEVGFAQQLDAVKDQVSGFAVAGQFAVRNPAHEIAARNMIIERTGLPVTCSHELSSKLDGPRRALTCVLNARLISLIHHLIEAAESLFAAREISAPVMVVRGDGALISADVAKLKPIETILSGPAASLVGASYLTGAPDALVSDIGGTTTDYAVLRDGQPRLDPDGATVGGWRTMVEAVAMRTIGLGGDSEVRIMPNGLSFTLELGPRRMIPLSLFAMDHPALVHETLDRQLKAQRRGDHDGVFALAVMRKSAHLSGLSKNETELFEELTSGPVSLDRLLQNRSQISPLNRLVARGLVMQSGMTPSDAAHVLGKHNAWDEEAARKGAQLFARQKSALGTAIAAGPHEISQLIIDCLVETSAVTLFEAAFAEDGFGDAALARAVFAAGEKSPAKGLVALSTSLDVPVIGLGASAPTYYPDVAARLGTEALIPGHAGVANAVGAVVGRVSVSVEASISQPSEGLFRVYSSGPPKDFLSMDAAVTFAEGALSEDARNQAREAGADDIEIKLDRIDRMATVEGQDMLVESRLTATAAGRPRIAA